MRRLCERPGCVGPAEVSYGMDNAQLLVWLSHSHVPEREHAGRLCRRHADALVVPRGWTIDDRRQPIPQLFRDLPRPNKKSPASTGSAPRKPRRAARALSARPDESNEIIEPTLFEQVMQPPTVAHDQEHVAQAIDPDETRAIAWSPAAMRRDDGETDNNNEQPVFGRLLGRAFRQQGTEQ